MKLALMLFCLPLSMFSLVAHAQSFYSCATDDECAMVFSNAVYFTDMNMRLDQDQVDRIYRFAGETPVKLDTVTRVFQISNNRMSWQVQLPHEIRLDIAWGKNHSSTTYRLGAGMFINTMAADSSDMRVGIGIGMDTTITYVSVLGNKALAPVKSPKFLDQYNNKKITQLNKIQAPPGQEKNVIAINNAVKLSLGIFAEALRIRKSNAIVNVKDENFLRPR